MSSKRKKKNLNLKKNKIIKGLSPIDMNYIPQCLRNEGYYSGLEDNSKVSKPIIKNFIPDYLKCPVCRELFISPEMFSCGHTICKVCTESRPVCPVCKTIEHRSPVPNFIVSQLIDTEYSETQKRREKELEEVQELRKKVMDYIYSSRYEILGIIFRNFMMEKRYARYNEILNFFLSTDVQNQLESPIKEEELKYFLASKFNPKLGYSLIGEYIVLADNYDSFLNWLDNQIVPPTRSKKKASQAIDHFKIIPLLLVSFSHVGNLEIYQRLATIYKIDIGKELPLEEWKNQSSYWAKDIKLGIVNTISPCSCGLHHSSDGIIHSDSDSESDGYVGSDF